MVSWGLIISGGAIIYVPIYKQKKIEKKKIGKNGSNGAETRPENFNTGYQEKLDYS